MINDISDKRLIDTLNTGGIAVIRTDTLYGIVSRAYDEQAVEKVYEVKGRNPHKSCIVLLDRPESSFGHSQELRSAYDVHSHVPTSFLIDAEEAPRYLLRENNQIAYRIPRHDELRALLHQTGPLIAPSANPQGDEPAHTIQEAMHYFGDRVDIYVDGGDVPVDALPSRIMRIHNDGSVERLR